MSQGYIEILDFSIEIRLKIFIFQSFIDELEYAYFIYKYYINTLWRMIVFVRHKKRVKHFCIWQL